MATINDSKEYLTANVHGGRVFTHLDNPLKFDKNNYFSV